MNKVKPQNDNPIRITQREYKTILEKVWDEDEGQYYYIAWHEEFGKYSCRGEGETADEAFESLDVERADLIDILLEKGKPIPEPIAENDEILPSGNFPVRTSPVIHQRLLKMAKEMKISLNLLVNQLLTQNLTCEQIFQYFDERLAKTEIKIDRNFQEIKSIQEYETKTENTVLDERPTDLKLYRADNWNTKYAVAT